MLSTAKLFEIFFSGVVPTATAAVELIPRNAVLEVVTVLDVAGIAAVVLVAAAASAAKPNI